MRRTAIVLTGVAVFVAIGIAMYHWVSPKVELTNRSEEYFSELELKLPASRVSIGPIGSGDFHRIYFSAQGREGTARYAIRRDGNLLQSGSVFYPGGSELFRVVRVTVNEQGKAVVEVLE